MRLITWISIACIASLALLVGLVCAWRAPIGRDAGTNDWSQVEHYNVGFDVSPDGSEIVFSSADGDLYLLSRTSWQVRQFTKTDVVERWPRFSPDGNKIAYAAGDDQNNWSSIFVRSLESGEVQRLTDSAGVRDSRPSFSADGSRITFVRAHRHRPYSMGGWTWDDWDVYVINADGTQMRRITQQKYYQADHPVFSRDGETILYCAAGHGKDSQTRIIEVDVEGGTDPRLLTRGWPREDKWGASASNPAVSSDSKRVVFISCPDESFRYDVCIMDRAGRNLRPLGVTQVSRYNQSPLFMPDGKHVLFLAGTECNAYGRAIYSLWQVDTEGKNVQRIADSGLFTNPGSWRPKP